MTDVAVRGLSLTPFRALRPAADGAELGRLLCPPYDVIDDAERARLVAASPDNAVTVILPQAPAGGDRYAQAAQRIEAWVRSGHLRVDPEPALYVYEMQDAAGVATRGLLGALELRDPADGVVLPHENTMAGPVADRLALMSATEADLEPIYLVYDGGGAASDVVRQADQWPPLADATTADGMRHRLWAVLDPRLHEAIAADLATRRALIADGHHRYATYRELQGTYNHRRGAGPWDRGLTLLVDSTSYGPQVHAVHRVLVGMALDDAITRAVPSAEVIEQPDIPTALDALRSTDGFAVVLADGERTALLRDPAGTLAAAAREPGEPDALAELDVSVLHRGLVQRVWQLPDTVDTVGYAHSIDEALANARDTHGTAVLLRATPVAAVAAVAAAGGRMPRKSTLFTPKPASGLVMRRFVDEL